MIQDQARGVPIVYTARWIVPIESDPIEGGWIRIEGERVVEIQPSKPPRSAIDLGDSAILPGLVNAHTHLEFSDLQEPIGERGTALPDWIGKVIESRSATTDQEKRSAIESGINESVAAGVRLIGEIASPPCQYQGDTVDLVAFAEVIGLSESRWRERMQAAQDHNRLFDSGAWSPHAPYSTSMPAIEACVQRSIDTRRSLAMHVAESPAERELLCNGTGPFADSLRSIGVWNDGQFPWQATSVVELIDMLSRSPLALLVHGNDLREKEIAAIAKYAHLSVVYCPRTHYFFGYDRHPVSEMLAAGIRVALGTDSRASNPDLNLWSEVQFLLNHRMDIAPDNVLKMATMWGADAMGHSRLGRIGVDCKPGLGVVKTESTTVSELYRDLAINSYQPLDA